MANLSQDELRRYSRHLVLKDFGMRGQLSLKNSKVLVVGAGGLGSPVLLYLASAGVGTLGVADDDDVEISNLQRQVIFTVEDLGENKSRAAVARLKRLNPLITLRSYPSRIDAGNALGIIGNYDAVVDCTDNFATRYLLNDACVIMQRPLVYGSILEFEGHVAVFNFRRKDGTFSANYRDLFPEPPDSGMAPDCEQAGVIGVMAGMIGTMQANEVIKVLTGSGEPLADQLLIIDSQTMEQNLIRIPRRDPPHKISALIDYEDFCGISQDKAKSLNGNQGNMKEVTAQELKDLKESGADFQLIDVREPHEYEICNLEGELIPMSEIPYNVDKISKDKKVILHCRSGKRSGDMLLWLEKNHGFKNLYNLKGGVLAWAREVDPEFPTY